MFKQVVLSTTRPKTPSFFSSTSTPPRDDSSINDSSPSDLISGGGGNSRRDSSSIKQYLGRSLSWDIVIEGETSEKCYKADTRRRSKSAKVMKPFRGDINGGNDDDYIDYIDDSIHEDITNSRISEERSSQEVSSSSVGEETTKEPKSTDHQASLNIEVHQKSAISIVTESLMYYKQNLYFENLSLSD